MQRSAGRHPGRLESADASSRRSRRVLLVEDDRDLRELLRTALEGSGVVVTTAIDGREALQRLCAETFDAAILEARLPGLTGLDVLRGARARLVETPAILVTSVVDRDLVARVQKLRATHVVEKPLEPDDLRERVEALILDAERQASRQ